jgi:quercetin dioxygenase-like cupin family protein
MGKLAYLSVGIVVGVLLGTSAFSKQGTGTLDPAKLAPQMYRVILDNSKLRVMDYHLKPGKQEPLHSHPNGTFVYFFTDADMQPVSGGNETHNRVGDAIWRDPVTHAGKNTGASEVHALLVEPKESCK